MHLLLGGTSAREKVGLAPAGMVVIETDGSIEQEDTLKIAFDGARRPACTYPGTPSTPPCCSRRSPPARSACGHSPQCRACPVPRSAEVACTPPLPSGHGFPNPSVYCPDLLRLIEHIQENGRNGPVGPIETTEGEGER